MTTAHRPTWKAAVGKANEGGWTAGGAPSGQRSALSLPGHTKLKTRRDINNQEQGEEAISQKRQELLKKSLQKLREMEEKKLGPRAIDERIEEEGRKKLLMSTADIDEEALRKKYDDADADGDTSTGIGIGNGKKTSGGDGWSDVEDIVDDESDLFTSDSDDDDDDSDDDSDDEDEEAALQAELAKIRAEREEAKRKAEAEAQAEEQSRMEESALIGNPLLNASSVQITGKLKRRWNDDVVFRNQAKNEPEQKKRFINDTVRNDFHKRFLNKFIR